MFNTKNIVTLILILLCVTLIVFTLKNMIYEPKENYYFIQDFLIWVELVIATFSSAILLLIISILSKKPVA